MKINTVADLANLMDEKFPGWHLKVDVLKLDLAHINTCILEQSVDGGYSIGRRRLLEAVDYDNEKLILDFLNKNEYRQAWITEIGQRKGVQMPTMVMPGTFEWAVVQLRAGKKIYRKEWTDNYIHLAHNNSQGLKWKNGSTAHLHAEHYFTHTDYKIWEEPKLTFKDLRPGDKFNIIEPNIGLLVVYQKLCEPVFTRSGTALTALVNLTSNPPSLAEVLDHHIVKRV